jgi:formylglycine-generating enzyme required for sulfatase activity
MARERTKPRFALALLAFTAFIYGCNKGTTRDTAYHRELNSVATPNTIAATITPASEVNSVSFSNGFQPTNENRIPAPELPTEDMVWIPGGEFSMGANEPPDADNVGMLAMTDARPIHRVYVDGFYMDKTDVTNTQFAKFVKATGYLTVAERTPRAQDFPNVPPENLVAGSVVFSPPSRPVPLNDHFQWWSYVHGADWRHPDGPKSNIHGKENYRSCRLLMKMLSLMHGGLAKGCLPKRNGSSQRAAARPASRSFGDKSFGRTANGWPTPIKATFPKRTPAKTDSSASHR